MAEFVSLRSRCSRVLTAIILLLISLWLLGEFSHSSTLRGSVVEVEPESKPDRTVSDVSSVKLLGLDNFSPSANIATIHLQAELTDDAPSLIEDLDVPLPDFHVIGEDDALSSLGPLPPPVRVKFADSLVPPDASSLMFGVATTLERLDDSLDGFSYWASGTGAKFVAIISPTDDPRGFTVSGVIAKANTLGIMLKIVELDEEFINRYVLLLKVLHEHMTPQTRWAGLIDDDTFFPSMSRLLKMLARYDATEPRYIGGVTEDFESIPRWGYMAFGGAGVFLSRTLLQQIHPRFDQCFNLPLTSGDGRISQCIYRFSTAKLTWEHGLHQLDLHGDYSGFFEAIRPVALSLHHWKSWGHHDVVKIFKIAKICGSNGVLQKYQFADGWVMTNGFSIVRHSAGTENSEMLSYREGLMERTWDVVGGETPETFLHSLEPLGPRDEMKESYKLEQVVDEGEKTMVLVYVKRGMGGIGEGIIKVVWTRE